MRGVLQTSVKFMKWKCMTFYVLMGQVLLHDRPDVMLVGDAPHDVVLSLYLRNNSIDFDNSGCI